jgi:hypothetical protein
MEVIRKSPLKSACNPYRKNSTLKQLQQQTVHIQMICGSGNKKQTERTDSTPNDTQTCMNILNALQVPRQRPSTFTWVTTKAIPSTGLGGL